MGAAQKEAPKWTKPEYKKITESYLRDYPLLKQLVQDEEKNMFPSCTPSYDFDSGGKSYSKYQSTTEKYGLVRAANPDWLIVERIERALEHVLSDEERKIIEAVYFKPWRFPGVLVFSEQNGWSKRKYHMLKSSALNKIARILGLI